MAVHIHRYFAHASPQKLKDFVQKTNHPMKDDIARELDGIDCEICQKHKRETPKPKTSLPLADRFNQTVALDLKFLDDSTIILHCIDLLTRYSAAMIISNKTAAIVVEGFLRTWIAIFGSPEQTLCDNGKEFCNQDFLDMCQNMNINMKTTSCYQCLA